jgi:hypothetical protein
MAGGWKAVSYVSRAAGKKAGQAKGAKAATSGTAVPKAGPTAVHPPLGLPASNPHAFMQEELAQKTLGEVKKLFTIMFHIQPKAGVLHGDLIEDFLRHVNPMLGSKGKAKAKTPIPEDLQHTKYTVIIDYSTSIPPLCTGISTGTIVHAVAIKLAK